MDFAINFALNAVIALLFLFFGLMAGGFIGRFLLDRLGTSKTLEAEERAVQIIQDAQREAQAQTTAKLDEVNEEWKRKKREFESELQAKNNRLAQLQKQVQSKEELLNKRAEQLQKRERAVEQQQKDLQNKSQILDQKTLEYGNLIAEQNKRLESISNLNADDAKAMLIDNMISKAKQEAQTSLELIQKEAQENSGKIAEKVILSAIERTSLDQAAENAITTIHLQNDELKGRIIGREGRNIKAFENTTGVDIIVDDTPEVVILSCFDPIRRETAKLTLQRLLTDGVIHPGSIEKSYQAALKDIDEIIISTGEETVSTLGVTNLHPDIIKLIGKMKFRSYFGQNLLKHSHEVAVLAGLMAAELKLDSKLAKRAGLLHDIGKMLDEPETSHALSGMEYLKKFKEHPVVLNAIGSHHGEIPKEYPISDIVDAANVISGARPGARGAITAEGYIKRLESLEEIARQFPGVTKTYALQAGREIRVIVEGEKVNDTQSEFLAKDIANRIMQTVQYPGQIKITVVRETRSVAYAK
ncbi:MAG: ribonuclease Y [Chloroherpetonaceae bacterium]|nr:ribonuclease Y [Chloroherpetonaceae bacterium]